MSGPLATVYMTRVKRGLMSEIHLISKIPSGFCFPTLFIGKSCPFLPCEVSKLRYTCVLNVGITVSIDCLVIGR